MYLPPFDAILNKINIPKNEFEKIEEVCIPAELLKLLLQISLISVEFNEAVYLAANPDVTEGIRNGKVSNARAHFVSYGYFEGRHGATPPVDEEWYLNSYQDVAAAIQNKTTEIKTAAEHFDAVGAAEGRSPSAKYVSVAQAWKKALSRS